MVPILYKATVFGCLRHLRLSIGGLHRERFFNESTLLRASSRGSESGMLKMLSSGLGSSMDRPDNSRAFSDAFLAAQTLFFSVRFAVQISSL